MRAPSPEHRRELERHRREIHPVDRLQADTLAELAALWRPRVEPGGKDCDEEFEVCLPDGSTTGVGGPRWLFHLLGIPHRSIYVGLSTPGGLLLLQRRSPLKLDYPDLWDLTASGHVSRHPGETGESSFQAAALRELAEELGLGISTATRNHQEPLRLTDVREYLVDGALVEVGSPVANPPAPSHRWWHCDVEVFQLFAGTITGEGLAVLSPQRAEVAGIYLCPLGEARRIHDQESTYRRESGSHSRFMAPGGYVALPHYLAWLESRDRAA